MSYPTPFPSQGGPAGVPGGMPGGLGGMPGSPGGVPGAVPSNTTPPAGDSGKKGKKGKGSTKDGKTVTKRTGFNYKVGIGIAVLVGLGALVAVNQGPPSVYVVRTNAPVTALSTLDRSQLTAVAVPEDYVETGAITGSSEKAALDKAVAAIGSGVTQIPLQGKQQLHADQFTNATRGTLANDLAPNERLVSISANVARSVAGTIRAGDRVDIIAVTSSGDSPEGNVVAYDVPVVSVTPGESAYQDAANSQTGENKDATPSELLPGNPVPGTYVVRVSAELASNLAIVNSGADIYLSYRAPGAQNVPQTSTDLLTIIGQGAPNVAN